jgi:hypothetical protein
MSIDFDSLVPVYVPETGISLHNYEHSDCIESGKFHDQLNECSLIKKDLVFYF